MLPAMEDPAVRGVQPLLLYPDDTIQSAGFYFPAKDTLPSPFLVGHPPEDAHRAGDRPFHAISGAAMLLRAEELEELGGFDVEFVNGMEDVDLCLRMSERFGGRFAVAPDGAGDPPGGQDPGRPHRPGAAQPLGVHEALALAAALPPTPSASRTSGSGWPTSGPTTSPSRSRDPC